MDRKCCIILICFFIISIFFTSGRLRADDGRLLSGNGWFFVTDAGDSGAVNGYQEGLPEGKIPVAVPHTWNVAEGTERYVGKAWYEKTFDLSPREIDGMNIFLKFNAVNRDAVVYVNGREAGRHVGSGYTAFYVDITDFVRTGKNLLVVSVDNSYSACSFPYMDSFDWADDGGIIRDVRLLSEVSAGIRYLHVDADVSGSTVLKVKFFEDTDGAETVAANVKITDWNTGRTELDLRKCSFTRNGEGEYVFSCKIDDPELWHFDRPELYSVSVRVAGEDGAVSEKTARYGYRSIELKGNALYLNGEQVRLPGVEWMPGSNPDYGIAEPFEYSREVLETMKNSNSVITRFHWQQDPAVLDWMDENGMLVQIEIPWWQQPFSLDDRLFDVAKMQVAEMVEADYNHPSVFAWAINNEVGRQELEDSRQVLDYVRSKDGTRFVNIVSNRIFASLAKDPSLAGDIPTWNEYVGTWAGKDRSQLPGFLDRIEKVLDGRPLFITEAGLCEPRFSGGDERRTSDMRYHYSQWAGRDWIAGTIYFSLNDYRTHKGESGTGRYCQRIHGVTDMYNRLKDSYYVLSELQSPVEVIGRDGRTVWLRCRDGLPKYSVRGYYAVSGREKVMIEDMAPGETANIRFRRKVSSFTVYRPGGYVVCTWSSDPGNQ